MWHWLYGLADRLRDAARRRRWSPEMATGRRGEDLAHRFLERHGYRVVARNFRTPDGGGELDLVAWDGGTLVFVEVKTRTGDGFGPPDRAVDRDKRGHLDRAGRFYARRAGVALEMTRFDVVNVILGDHPKLEVVRDAFRETV